MYLVADLIIRSSGVSFQPTKAVVLRPLKLPLTPGRKFRSTCVALLGRITVSDARDGVAEGAKMSVRDAKRCRDRAEELRISSVLMTADDCLRIRRELAAEYEAIAEQWETISVLTALLGTK
jgi:hypothetical protein